MSKTNKSPNGDGENLKPESNKNEDGVPVYKFSILQNFGDVPAPREDHVVPPETPEDVEEEYSDEASSSEEEG